MNTPDQVFTDLLHKKTHVNLQNILMPISDRELAICMLYLSEKERQFLFSFLSSVKQKRINQEQKYLKSLNISYLQYRTVIDDVILRLQGIAGEGIRSYVRPRR